MARVYNRYEGNSGRVRRVDDSPAAKIPPNKTPAVRIAPKEPAARPQSAPGGRPTPPPPFSRRPPGPLQGLSGELGRLLGKLSPMKLENDDLLIIMVLYLMYRQSRDEELLFIMAAMFLL